MILSTNERELYLTDPVYHHLVDRLVQLATDHPVYAEDDGRRLVEAVNTARAILEERRALRERATPREPRASVQTAHTVLALRHLGEQAAQSSTENDGKG